MPTTRVVFVTDASGERVWQCHLRELETIVIETTDGEKVIAREVIGPFATTPYTVPESESLQQQVTGLAVELRQTRETVDRLEAWLQRTRDELVELKDHAVVSKGGQTVLLPNGLYVDLGYLASQAKDVPALRSHLSSLSVEVSQLRQDVLALGLKTVALGELITARLGEQAGQIEVVEALVRNLRHEAMHAHENMVDAVRVLQERVLQLEIMHTVPEPPDRT